MSAPILPNFPLPAVHNDLSPYIRTPSRIHQTRQLLSTHLASLTTQPRISSASGSSDEFTRFLDLELSHHPSIRRKYLTALRENAQARRKHAAALAALHTEETIPDDDDNDSGSDNHDDDDNTWKDAYLHTLRIRRQINRLTVLREGVAALANVAPTPRDLARAHPHPAPAAPEELHSHRNAEKGGAEGVDDALVLQLAKRIVAVSEELLRPLPSPPPQRREEAGALQAVRTELMVWIETALSVPEAAAAAADGKARRSSRSVEQVVAQIEEAYSGYLDARREMLALVAGVQENPPPIEAHEDSHEVRALLDTHRIDIAPPMPAPQVLRVLAAAEHLLPLAKTHRSLLAALNHHSSAVARARAKVADVLEDGGGVSAGDPVSSARARGEDAVRAMARAEKSAQGHVENAMKRLEEAKTVAEEVETLCGGEKRRSVIPVRAKGRGPEQREEGSNGIWAGLVGGVGLIGDGI